MNEGADVLSVSILEANSLSISAHQNNALTYFIVHSSICPFFIQVFGVILIKCLASLHSIVLRSFILDIYLQFSELSPILELFCPSRMSR